MGGADYLGPEMNGDTYRFKFIQNGRVIWVDVDGQGRVIRRSKRHESPAAALISARHFPLFRISNFSPQDGLTAKMNRSGEFECVS